MKAVTRAMAVLVAGATMAVATMAVATAPAEATLRVSSELPNGLQVLDLHSLNDRIAIGTASLNGSPAFRITNNNAGDVFAFDRGPGCFEAVGSGGRALICERLNREFRVALGAGEDHLDLSGAPAGRSHVEGGDGRDVITGHAGTDIIDGENGPDSIAAVGGEDVVTGGDGGDSINGGPGFDTLHGQSGADGIDGGQQADFVKGGAGNDAVRGGAGSDVVLGSEDDDTVVGNDGEDDLRGGSGEDTLVSKEENLAAPEPDTVTCGLGFDGVVADLQDQDIDLVSNPGGGTCEEIERSPVREHPHVRVVADSLVVGRDGTARVFLSCPRATKIGCRGTLSLRLLRRGTSRPAPTAYAIRPGRSARVRVRLTAAEARRARGGVRGVRGVLKSVERGRRGPKTTIRLPWLR